LHEPIGAVADDADLERALRHGAPPALFVCTRARDHLLVPGLGPAPEFLDDLGAGAPDRPPGDRYVEADGRPYSGAAFRQVDDFGGRVAVERRRDPVRDAVGSRDEGRVAIIQR
jgi:hypothetical protein